jgi:hypothetical protein
MSKPKSKLAVERFDEEEIVSIIGRYFDKIQSPGGKRFYPTHLVDNTMLIEIGTQTFIVTVKDKSNLN